jgi:2-iminobutanoate/2-iminopropanoate deaminase
MTINKEAKSLDMPWEKEYGYAQAVKVKDIIYLSGQMSHDDWLGEYHASGV